MVIMMMMIMMMMMMSRTASCSALLKRRESGLKLVERKRSRTNLVPGLGQEMPAQVVAVKLQARAQGLTPEYVQASSRSEARATAVVVASPLQPAITLLSPVTTNPASPSPPVLTKVDRT